MEEFKQVHAQVLKWENSFCASNLVATCALSDWGSMDYACSIFRQIDQPGTFEFNTMIRGYVNAMNMENALFLFSEMLERGVESDNFTYPALFKACARLRSIEEGMQIHGYIFKRGLEGDLFVQNSLINMYGKCGKIKLSCSVFEKMDYRDVASWSAIIAAHASLGMWSECLSIFGEMSREGSCRAEESILVSVLSACTHLGALDLGRCTHVTLLRNIREMNVIVQTSLMDMYVKCGRIEKSISLFQRMVRKNQLSYSVMISGFAMHGRGMEALQAFSDMLEEGLEPDNVVYLGVLSACNHAGLVDEGLRCFNRMKLKHGIEPTIQHYGCIVHLMGRAGMLNEALELIRSMPIKPNEVVWRSLLSACKFHQNLEIGEIAYKRTQKIFVIELEEEFPLFSNHLIERSLSNEAREAFLSALVSEGRAEWLDRGHRKCLILWHRIQDWADILLHFVRDNGFEDSVMTVEEIRTGVESRGTELHGIDRTILTRALKLLENKGKLAIFKGTSADDEGVKFSV
ncbi:hypothetical protein SADUNF_Sadunf01G0110000 [Salix dunnii]|uniref:ESCRT-II complex subunit VPS25 n=1 Tax=Salix dunnii TaxID=1413687 RepID=A0A835NBP4_9ROSI|nr:hypothetical protein SADUNF_Sadunf01G0110000 [Salix dunnii]